MVALPIVVRGGGALRWLLAAVVQQGQPNCLRLRRLAVVIRPAIQFCPLRADSAIEGLSGGSPLLAELTLALVGVVDKELADPSLVSGA
jgi:hypothetical protein